MSSIQRYDNKEEGFLFKLMSDKFVQAGISAIPYAGGPAQVIISGYIQELKERKWIAYWNSLEQRVDEIGRDKVDPNYFATEDFLQRIRVIHEEVTGRSDDEKIKYLREYFIGCIWYSAPDATWKDLFLQYLTRLSGAHLGILHTFFNIQRHLSVTDRFNLPQRISGESPLTIQDIGNKLHHYDQYLIEILIADLDAIGLVHLWTGQSVEPRGWSISNSGLLFMRFLNHMWQQPS